MSQTKNLHQDKPVSVKDSWLEHIEAHNHSGLSRAEYCRQNGLSYHAMTYWYRKLKANPQEEMSLVPISLEQEEVEEKKESTVPQLRLTFPDGIGVEIGDNFSESTLSRLLFVLRQAPCC